MLIKNGRPLLVGLFMLPLVTACGKPKTALEQVLADGELRVVTRNSATSYYEGPDGPTGMEYDLVKGFADELGVNVRMVVASNVSEVLDHLARGDVHFAAAGLAITEYREQWVRFTPAYQSITPQLVYRLGRPAPRSLNDLNGNLEVVFNSSHAESLRALKGNYLNLSWMENQDASSEELLSQVWDGELDYTVADSNEVAINRHYYPELRVAFDLGAPQPIAWAFPRSKDDSLYRAATLYFEALKADGRLNQLLERHYSHRESFDYVGAVAFRKDIKQKLPSFRADFEKAAITAGLDWRLVAAIGYQESHWNPSAVSPTGVRGLMQLTSPTAVQMGVARRNNAAESIDGGVRYFRKLLDLVPSRIPDPDRVWMALAAYNVGIGHLEDARVITQRRGGNPDRWMDVKESLPLLQNEAWYLRTKHGYARGNEAYRYVENIRSYYDVLVWVTEQLDEERDNPRPMGETLAAAGAL